MNHHRTREENLYYLHLIFKSHVVVACWSLLKDKICTISLNRILLQANRISSSRDNQLMSLLTANAIICDHIAFDKMMSANK